MSNHHDKYDVVHTECIQGLSNTDLFMKKLGIDNLLGNPTYTPTSRHIQKRKSMTIINLLRRV